MNNCDFKGTKKEDSSFNNSSYTSHFFQSAWIRCFICSNDEIDKLISGNRHYFLLHLNPLFLFVLFLIKEKIMNI